jgi:hypothetical protein
MRKLFCALLLLLPSFSAAQSLRLDQETQPTEDPQARSTRSEAKPRLKMGVALEGGGALGLAHIGVLQWSEDHHIPVDYIGGTSMLPNFHRQDEGSNSAREPKLRLPIGGSNNLCQGLLVGNIRVLLTSGSQMEISDSRKRA